jgi:hypothetical protein
MGLGGGSLEVVSLGKEPVFVPVVNGVVNQNEWLADGALSAAHCWDDIL